ncbi:DMT family transporter [Arcobacter sp. HD9-500m-PIT-SAG02]|nr:DMT family transporter [Arcobacter sp. HD9-500m-PIT-SAG02]
MSCVLFWSGNFVIARFIHDDIAPIELVFFRWFSTLVVLSPLLFIHRKKIFTAIKNHFLIMMTFSLLGISGYNSFVYLGLQTTTATNALLINSSVPIMIIFLAALIFKQKISLMQMIGIGLSTLGVVFLVLQGDFTKIDSIGFNPGDIWIIIAGLSWALYSVLMKYKPKDLHGLEFLTAVVFLGSIVLLGIYLFSGYGFTSGVAVVSNNYWVILYLVIFPSILSYVFWHKGIDEIGANKTGQFTHLMPVFGSVLAFVFLNESLELFHFMGISLIGFGIYLSLFLKKTLKTIE